MQMWAAADGGEAISIEAVDRGAVSGPLYIDLHCPGCGELQSALCECEAKDEPEREILCACVPEACPSCGVALGGSDRTLLETA